MPDQNPIEQLRRRLLELGCPPNAARKILRETAEHYEDLQRSAIAAGLSPAAASAQAAEQLGDPQQLAERHVVALRQSSWWGRHPVMGFGVVPLLLAPLLLFASMAIGLGAGFAVIHAHFSETPSDSQWILVHQPTLFIFGFGALWVGTAAMAFFVCRKVRQASLAGRWLLAACGIISIYALFFITLVETSHGPPPYSTVVLFFSRPDRLSFANALIPWAVAGLLYVRERRAAKLLLRESTQG